MRTLGSMTELEKLGEVLERTKAEQQGNEERKVKLVRREMLKQVKRKVVTRSI